MHCEKAEMLLAQMAFGELDAGSPGGAEVAAHLAGCRACAELLNDMRVAAGLAREGVMAGAAPKLSETRRAVILGKAAEIAAGRRTGAARRRPGTLGSRGRVIGLTSAAAAAVLLAGAMLRQASMETACAPKPCVDEVVIMSAPECAKPAPAGGGTSYWEEKPARDLFKSPAEPAASASEDSRSGVLGFLSVDGDYTRSVRGKPGPAAPRSPQAEFKSPGNGYDHETLRKEVADARRDARHAVSTDGSNVAFADGQRGHQPAKLRAGLETTVDAPPIRNDMEQKAYDVRDLSKETARFSGPVLGLPAGQTGQEAPAKAAPPPPPPAAPPERHYGKAGPRPEPPRVAEKPGASPAAPVQAGKDSGPVAVRERGENADHFEAENGMGRRGDEEVITDIPLGSTGTVGTVGTVGVGGGRLTAESQKKEPAQSRETVDALLARARFDLQNGKYEEAEAVSREARKLDPSNKDALALHESSRDKMRQAGEAKIQQNSGNERSSTMQNIEDASVPYSRAPVYPEEWKELAKHAERKRLAEDLANAEYMLKQAVKNGWKPQAAANGPDVRTKVVDVRTNGNVAVSAGSDSGVREGNILVIRRGGEYIGKVRVTTVWNDFAGGQVIEQKKPFRPDDDAMSIRDGGTADLKSEAVRDWVGLSQAAMVPYGGAQNSPRAKAAQELVNGAKATGEGSVDGKEASARPPFIVLNDDGGRGETQQKQIAQQPQQPQQGQQQIQAQPLPVEPPPAANPANVSDAGGETEAALPPAAAFKVVPVNPFVMAAQDRLSTFALDVDTASYSIARRYIRGGYLPPVGAVRMEEFVNAFDYNYPRRTGGTFTVISEAAPAPFGEGLTLVKVGVRARVVGREGRKSSNLVFVVDASGSMAQTDRMPLVKYALKELAGQLSASDRVSLVAYSTKARLALEAAGGADKEAIGRAIDGVQCEGSTNLSEGLATGYRLAAQNFIPGGINRVILCSDGAANIGATAGEEILGQVKAFRDKGITCTCVGFGAGTYNDALLEKLADSGDGSYAFVDSKAEARRIFVEELSATLQTVAKDAKIQVDFDPARVRRYRLIGYENRDIADDKFRDDTVDAGEVGSGQSATALYEVELQGARGADLGTVYVRYRDVDSGRVEEISHRLEAASVRARTPESDPRFFLAACAAEFAELLRTSEHAAGGSFDALRETLERAASQPALRDNPRVQELLELVRRAKGLPRAG